MSGLSASSQFIVMTITSELVEIRDSEGFLFPTNKMEKLGNEIIHSLTGRITKHPNK